MENMQTKTQNQSLNVMKCVAIFAVIFIHAMTLYDHGTIGKMIMSTCRFAVPFFFLISGFYSYYSSNEYAGIKYKSRIIRLLKLILLSGALFYVVAVIKSGSFLNAIPIFDLPHLGEYIIFNKSPFVDPLWFLQALLYCYILFYILNRYEFKISRLYFLIPILLGACLLLGDVSKLMGMGINRIYFRNFFFIGLPFFLIGYMLHEKEDDIKSISNKTLAAGIIGSTIVTLFEPIILNISSDLFMGSMILAILIMIWCVNNPQKLNFKLMGWIGGTLYTQMYILHILVIKLFKKSIHFGFLDPFAIFILTLLITSISALRR